MPPTLALANETESGAFTIEFSEYHNDRIGIEIVNEDGDLINKRGTIFLDKNDAKHLVAYLKTAFDL